MILSERRIRMSPSMMALAALAVQMMLWMAPSEAQQPAETTVKAQDGTPMALILEGEFEMGSHAHEGEPDERPRHRVYLPAFYMDKYQVTAARYAKFLEASKREPPRFWSEVRLSEEGDRPVVGVDWMEAEAYCRWTGKRLPTEAEGEKAARGTDGRKYPWGNDEPTRQHANFGQDKEENEAMPLTPVGRYEAGKSPYGIYDMAGNVWEWTADWYDEKYYSQSAARSPKGPAKGLTKVTRGGAWDRHQFNLRTANRSSMNPTDRIKSLGFRCAQDGPP